MGMCGLLSHLRCEKCGQQDKALSLPLSLPPSLSPSLLSSFPPSFLVFSTNGTLLVRVLPGMRSMQTVSSSSSLSAQVGTADKAVNRHRAGFVVLWVAIAVPLHVHSGPRLVGLVGAHGNPIYNAGRNDADGDYDGKFIDEDKISFILILPSIYF